MPRSGDRPKRPQWPPVRDRSLAGYVGARRTLHIDDSDVFRRCRTHSVAVTNVSDTSGESPERRDSTWRRSLEILLTGATGFIGRALTGALLHRGDGVVAVTRSVPKAGAILPSQVTALEWSPPAATGEWADRAMTVDAVVNLAGEPIADKRWSAKQKNRILQSRLAVTDAVVAALTKNDKSGRTLVNGSAIGYYGSRGDELLTEDSTQGKDFLASVVSQWEDRALRARASGVRVVLLRSGIVLGNGGGALPRLALPFRLCAGGAMGPAGQWLSWIHIVDEVGIILKALDDSSLSGPVNATAPAPTRMDEFSQALGRALKRPAWAPGIPLAMRLVLGERAEAVFSSQRVVPRAVQRAGYRFRHGEAGEALTDLVGKARAL